jgi:hypothetical protein
MPDPTHAPAARRPRRRSAPTLDPRRRRRELVDLIATGADAWQQLTPELLNTVCGCLYLEHGIGA